MSSVQQMVKTLLSNIQQDYKRYIKLTDLLNNQRTLMIARNVEGLESLNAELESLYQTLTHSTAERSSLLKQLNIPASPAGMQAFFVRLPAAFSDKARLLWNTLEEQVVVCKHINERNARLLNSQQETFNSLLGRQPDVIYQP
jgi:flagellar biosynthesis/type III secretory pathway chaperone